MPKYVAFLRAINVGGHTVKMETLRRLFEAQKFSNVETFIASGNVIFDSDSKRLTSLEKQIESSLEDALGYEVSTFIRSIPAVVKIANNQPFGADLMGPLYIGFLRTEPSNTKIGGLATDVDDFRLIGSQLYWQCRTKFSESKISGAVLEKILGMPMTLRNVTTVRKIAGKYSVVALNP